MLSNNKIHLSIIVPIYNVELYLKECLDSILSISIELFEVILVNDGSTDDSATIVKPYLTKYKEQITYIEQENKGLSEARNVGLKAAQGEYVLFVDSDDLIVSGAVPVMFEYAISNKLDILQVRGEKFTDSLSTLMPVPKYMLSLPITDGKAYLNTFCSHASVKAKNFRPEVWLLLIRTRFILRSNITFTPKIYYEDEIVTPSLILKAKRIKMLNILFYRYRVREHSITSTSTEKHIKSKARLLKLYLQLFKSEHFFHPFLSGRAIGWGRESICYTRLTELFSLLLIKKTNKKDRILLLLFILKKSIYLCVEKVNHIFLKGKSQ